MFEGEERQGTEQEETAVLAEEEAAQTGWRLTAAQARVLGALLEKEITTPDYYPLTMNALTSACNQRSNREPVMALDEEEIHLALRGLEERNLVGRARVDGRVSKYEHHLGEVFNFTRAETALICVLLLRGPQTPGELRGRSERLHKFDEIADVLSVLQKLMERDPALVAQLPRQPGTKELRYAHLLSGPVEGMLVGVSSGVPVTSAAHSFVTPAPLEAGAEARIAHLEAEVSELRARLDALQQKIDDLFA